MAQKVTITEKRQSVREYDQFKYVHDIHGGGPRDHVFPLLGSLFVDAETGIVVSDVAKLEAWIGGEGHGSDN